MGADIRIPVMFSSPELKHRYEQWNQALRENVSSFVSAHSGVTAFVFSSYALFSRMLDNPTDFGFPKGDAKKRGGTMWVDHLHPTSAVHKEVAGALSQFLTSQPAHSGQAT